MHITSFCVSTFYAFCLAKMTFHDVINIFIRKNLVEKSNDEKRFIHVQFEPIWNVVVRIFINNQRVSPQWKIPD